MSYGLLAASEKDCWSTPLKFPYAIKIKFPHDLALAVDNLHYFSIYRKGFNII